MSFLVNEIYLFSKFRMILVCNQTIIYYPHTRCPMTCHRVFHIGAFVLLQIVNKLPLLWIHQHHVKCWIVAVVVYMFCGVMIWKQFSCPIIIIGQRAAKYISLSTILDSFIESQALQGQKQLLCIAPSDKVTASTLLSLDKCLISHDL